MGKFAFLNNRINRPYLISNIFFKHVLNSQFTFPDFHQSLLEFAFNKHLLKFSWVCTSTLPK